MQNTNVLILGHSAFPIDSYPTKQPLLTLHSKHPLLPGTLPPVRQLLHLTRPTATGSDTAFSSLLILLWFFFLGKLLSGPQLIYHHLCPIKYKLHEQKSWGSFLTNLRPLCICYINTEEVSIFSHRIKHSVLPLPWVFAQHLGFFGLANLLILTQESWSNSLSPCFCACLSRCLYSH